jgi:stage V sporulation protein SpoVS
MTQPELEALELAMRELLSVLKSPDTTPEELRASWERCQSVGGGLAAILEGVGGGAEVDAETADALDRLVRLNAITRQAIVEQQAGLAASLVRTRASGTQVRGYATAPPSSGGKCDLAG